MQLLAGFLHGEAKLVEEVLIDLAFGAHGPVSDVRMVLGSSNHRQIVSQVKCDGRRPTACASAAAEGAQHKMASKSRRSCAPKAVGWMHVLDGAPRWALNQRQLPCRWLMLG